MAPSVISCVIVCLFLAFSNARDVDENDSLLKRFEKLEAKYEAEFAALKESVEGNERECERKVAAVEQRVRALENANAKLKEENRGNKREISLLTRKMEYLIKKKEKEEIILDKTSPDPSAELRKTEDDSRITMEQDGIQHERRDMAMRHRRALSNELHIAFTAYLDHDINNLGTDQIFVFNKVLLNDGLGYNNYTGSFIAPTSGVYSFSFFIGQRNAQEARAYLVVNGKHQVDAAVEGLHSTQDLQGGNTANLRLTKGDAVYVTHQGGYHHVEGDDLLRTTSFSGFLIYPLEEPDIVGK